MQSGSSSRSGCNRGAAVEVDAIGEHAEVEVDAIREQQPKQMQSEELLKSGKSSCSRQKRGTAV